MNLTNSEPTNNEGLTFREWLYASGNATDKFDLGEYRAWRNGEDPTEHRLQKSTE